MWYFNKTVFERAGHSKIVRIAGNTTGYLSAAHSWLHFASNRTPAGFIRAGANTGLAVARLHPFVNFVGFVMDSSGVSDRVYNWAGSKAIEKGSRINALIRRNKSE